MSWFPLLQMTHFAAFTIYVVLIIIILSRNFYSKSNRFAAGLLACFAIWSFAKIFLHNPLTPNYYAVLFERISVVGWATFPVFGFWFWVALSGNDRLYSSPLAVITSIISPLFFIWLNWTGLLMYAPVRMPYGWLNTWIQGSIFTYLFYFYYLGFLAYGMIYYIVSQKKPLPGLRKKMNFVLYFSAAATISVGTFFEVLTPLLKIKVDVFQDITNVYILIWALGIFFILLKYKFLALNPSTAAESIIDSMNEALVLLDDEMNISFVNKQLVEMLGYGMTELKGRPFYKLIHEKPAADLFLREVIRNRAFKSQEFRLKRRDGGLIPCIFSASLIMEFGEIRGIVCVANDITALINAEIGMREERDKAQKYMRELRESYDKLKELNVLKSNFTSMVSHELRTPITSIKGFVSFLIGGVGGQITPQQKEFLGIIKNNSDRLLTLINDLLDTSKMEQGSFSINKAPAELSFIIDSGIKDLQSLSNNRNISIVREFSPEKIVVSVDAYRISQAMVNLINNAIKFSPPDSVIKIRMDSHILKDIKIPSYAAPAAIAPGYYVRISVIDQGHGIEYDKLTRIFDKYYQVENINTRSAQGTGLGLNIVKNIVELHGGAVWAESEGPGRGAVFTFIIPQN